MLTAVSYRQRPQTLCVGGRLTLIQQHVIIIQGSLNFFDSKLFVGSGVFDMLCYVYPGNCIPQGRNPYCSRMQVQPKSLDLTDTVVL